MWPAKEMLLVIKTLVKMLVMIHAKILTIKADTLTNTYTFTQKWF